MLECFSVFPLPFTSQQAHPPPVPPRGLCHLPLPPSDSQLLVVLWRKTRDMVHVCIPRACRMSHPGSPPAEGVGKVFCPFLPQRQPAFPGVGGRSLSCPSPGGRGCSSPSIVRSAVGCFLTLPPRAGDFPFFPRSISPAGGFQACRLASDLPLELAGPV